MADGAAHGLVCCLPATFNHVVMLPPAPYVHVMFHFTALATGSILYTRSSCAFAQLRCLLSLCPFVLQDHINSPEALAAAAAAKAAAEEEANIAPVHEDNEWGIEVMADEPAAGAADASSNSNTGAGAAAEVLAEGLKYDLPQAGLNKHVLQQEAVKPTDASLDELTNMLSSLNNV